LFTGIDLETLEQQITIWKDSVEVLQAFPHVEPGSAVIIDEAQTVFRSMQKVEPGLLRWLETHRHYGVDILLMSQDFRQMSQGVTRLIEATVKFRKLAFVGLSKKYQGKVRGNPEDNEVIRAFVGTYSPAIYAYYSSYASAAIREGEAQSYGLQVGTGRHRHCGGPVCHWPYILAALVVVEQHERNSHKCSEWHFELASASICIGAGQSAESVRCVCPIDSEPAISQANGAHPRRGRFLGESSRLALSLGQRRDPDSGTNYRTVWPAGLGSL
jgi:hypothetical protein